MLLALAFLPIASAWTLGTGVRVQHGAADSVLVMGTSFAVTGVLTYEAATGAPIIGGYTLDLQPASGSWTWTLLSLSATNITISGTPPTGGTYRVAGLTTGLTYGVFGRAGLALTTFAGPAGTFNLEPGEQTVYIVPYMAPNTGDLWVSASYSWANQTIGASVTLRNTTGEAHTGQASMITLRLYLPGGEERVGTVTETTTPGVYRGSWNVSTDTLEAAYLVTAQYGNLTDGESLALTENLFLGDNVLDIANPALDFWFPILIWGGLFAWMLYVSAWLPAAAAFMGVLGELATQYGWTGTFVGRVACILLFLVALFLHKLLRDGPQFMTPWRRST